MSRQPNGMLQPTILVTKLVDRHHKHLHVEYATYRELRRDLKRQLEESVGDTISVARSKRGQGFEWFEIWELAANGKPRLVREGWQ